MYSVWIWKYMELLECQSERISREHTKHSQRIPSPFTLSSWEEGCDWQMIAKMVLGSTHLAFLPADSGDRLEEKKKKRRNFWRNVFKTTIVRHFSFSFFYICFGLYRLCFFFFIAVCRHQHMIRTSDLHTHTLDECFYTCLFMSTASFLYCFLFLCFFFSFSARRCQSFFVCVCVWHWLLCDMVCSGLSPVLPFYSQEDA